MKQFVFTSFLACALITAISPAKSRDIAHFQGYLQAVSLAGKVLDRDTKKPIAYASIGVLDESTGTISNEEGIFNFSIPANQQAKVVRISAIGYQAKELKVEELLASQTAQNEFTITLIPAPVQLSEVKVGTSKWKNKTLGGHAGPITMFYYSFAINPRPIQESLGREFGVLINSDQKTSFLKKLNYCVTSNEFNEVKFRVNVYALNKGMPGQNLLPEDIIVTLTDKERGWKQVNLEPYNLYLNQDFLITLEWIDSKPKDDFKSLTIAATLPGFHTVFMKDASQSKWDKHSASGIGMNVEVEREN